MSRQELEILHTVNPCARCNGSHDLTVRLRLRAERQAPRESVLLFGGAHSAELAEAESCSDSDRSASISYLCPAVRKLTTVEIAQINSVGLDRVLSVTVESVSATSRLTANAGAKPSEAESIRDVDRTQAANILENELSEWAKNSAATLRDFSKSMLATSIAAVPALFIVIKYLSGGDYPSVVWIAVASAAMTGLFLVAASLYMLALRPRSFRTTDLDEFASWREERLNATKRLSYVATSCFGIATFLAVCLFIYLLIVERVTP